MRTDDDIITDLLLGKHVDWLGVVEHKANSGKLKTVLRGIPNNTFWYLWKRKKDVLKSFGITVFCIDKQFTGETRTRKGRSFQVVRKQWEVSIWYNKTNTETLEGLGYIYDVAA